MIDKSVRLRLTDKDLSSTSSSSVLNLYCFNAAISACQKGGAWVEALEIFERMKACGRKDLQPNIVTYASIILALDDAGQKDVAVTMYNEGCRVGAIKPWRVRYSPGDKKIKSMDLHQFSAAMARAAIRSYIDQLLNQGKSKLYTIQDDWIIITGKGLNSEDGLLVLRPTVQHILFNEYGIHATVDESNVGRLIVSSNQLRETVSKKSWK